MKPPISKTTYLYGMQCQKRFYLNRFHKTFANPEDEQTQFIFQRGTDVGELAQQLFPGGVNAQGKEKYHSEKTVQRTQELLVQTEIIYEAAFIYNDVICAVDILVRNGNNYYAFEVKSTNSVKEQHLDDAALQYYVLSNCGLNLSNFSIVHFNRDYVRLGELDVKQLFTSSSVIEEVEARQKPIAKNIADIKKLVWLKKIPDVEMGSHCNLPYACNFSEYCLNQLPESEREMEEEVELDTSIRVDSEAWKSFSEDFVFPLYFFDFETVMYGVPEYNFSRPYQQIPFQYSLHVLLKPHSKPLHKSHLGDGISDPRPDLIEQMIRDLGESGSIVTWNITFERGVIAKLAIDFPEYQKELAAIQARLVDLMPPFRPNWGVVSSDAFRNSYSIKNILPVVVPKLSYQELTIQEGGTASFLYGQMALLEPKEREQLRADLLDYCHLDTLAMLRIWERIESLVNEW
jgi:hypothetical protein